MPNTYFDYADNSEEIIYCVFCDENYKYKNTFQHKHSKAHRDNRMAMLRNIPKQSEFCNGNDEECPHLVEENGDWWCGIGFESVYGKMGELRTGKEFMENERKPRRPMECTIAKPRELKKKPSSGPINLSGSLPYMCETVQIVKFNSQERINGGRPKIRSNS